MEQDAMTKTEDSMMKDDAMAKHGNYITLADYTQTHRLIFSPFHPQPKAARQQTRTPQLSIHANVSIRYL